MDKGKLAALTEPTGLEAVHSLKDLLIKLSNLLVMLTIGVFGLLFIIVCLLALISVNETQDYAKEDVSSILFDQQIEHCERNFTDVALSDCIAGAMVANCQFEPLDKTHPDYDHSTDGRCTPSK